MPNRLSDDEYKAKLISKNINIEPLEPYINSVSKILHRCPEHNKEFYIRPNDVLSGKTGCTECINNKLTSKLRKSHDQYVSEVAIKNPTIEVIGQYNGIYTKIAHRCKIHNVIWDAIPHNILYGAGCEQCRVERSRESQGINQEWYVNQLAIKNPNLEVLEEYKTIEDKISHKCKKHGVIWKISPANALKGCGCKECKKEKIHNAFTKTKEQYCEDLKNKNPNIVLIGEYYNTSTPTKHFCKIHNIEWDIKPCYVLDGTGCPECEKINRHNARIKSLDDYVNELNNKNPNLSLIDTYINSNTPILHKCKKHNYEWKITPSSALRGAGCPICASENLRSALIKSHEQYLKELDSLGLLEDIEVLEQYNGASNPIAHLCKKHNNIWYPTPGNVIRGLSRGCYECRKSLGESIVNKWLDNHNIKYITQYRFNDCKDSRPLPFDFYLPDHNKCIEFDGKQHFEPVEYFGGEESFKVLQLHDKIKDEYCKDNNIPLLRISYDNRNIDTELKQFIFN